MKQGINVPTEAITSLLQKHGYSLCNATLREGGFWNPVYFLTTGRGELVLKVTNPLWPVRKTLNEVAVLGYVSKHTTIPVPKIVAYSASTEELGHEYILMKRAPGSSLASVFDNLSARERKGYLDQLVDAVQELNELQFQEIGGFASDMKVTVDPWHSKGPHKTLSGYLDTEMREYVDSLRENKAHPCLADRFEAFRERFVRSYAGDCSIVLAHNDLQLKNIMVQGGRITAVLDWEWAMAAPRDLYFNTLTNTFDDCNEESRKYLYEALASRGLVKGKGVIERQPLFQATDMLMSLACYKPQRWFADKPEEEKRFETELVAKIDRFLLSFNV